MPHNQDQGFSQEAVGSAMAKAMEDINALKSEAPLTFGEKLVGLTFNPSNDDSVSLAKRLFAQIAELVERERAGKESTRLESILYNHTVGEILNAQMNVVKLLTLKY